MTYPVLFLFLTPVVSARPAFYPHIGSYRTTAAWGYSVPLRSLRAPEKPRKGLPFMDKTRLVCLVAAMLVASSIFLPAVARAGASVSPSSMNFGSVTVGSTSGAQMLVVTNNGNATVLLDQISCSSPGFVISGPTLPLSIGARQSVSFQVVFEPAAASAFVGNITVVTGKHAGASSSIPVSGTGVAAASTVTYLVTPSAGSVSFGNLLVGSSASQSLLLTNSGTGSVTVSQVAVTGSGYSVSGFSGAVSLAAGQGLSLAVNFAPASTGSVAGSLSVVSTATNSPAISLSGTGVQPLLSVVPSSVNFGNVTVGVSNSQTMTIQNPGTATLTLTQATLAGTGYGMSGLALPLSLAPGGSKAFNISFAPASANNLSGSLSLASDAPTSPTTIAFSGTGIAGVQTLSVNPTSLSFGSLTTGTSTSQSVTLTNTGNSTVTISQITASGTGFSTAGASLPVSLAAAQSTSFSVAFAPASAGNQTGSVTVASNATNSPLVVSLTGTATATAPATYSVNLSWTPSSSGYAGFHVYRGSVSGGPYSRIDSSLIASPSYADSAVTT